MSKRPNCFRFLPVLIAITATGCGPQGGGQVAPATSTIPADEPPAAASVTGQAEAGPAPSWQEAANASYAGVFDEAVVLQDGQWEGAPYAEGGASAPRAGLAADFLLQGDVDGDAAEESVVVLWSSGGGSGTFDYVAVLDRDADGAASNIAIAPLGDRVKIRSAAIDDGRIVFDVVQAGPDDAACCPGQKMRRTFALEGASMTETSTEDQGRLSLSDLEGVWQLFRFDQDEPVPEQVQITLLFQGTTIAGKAACNRFTGSVAEGDMPGELSLAGPLTMTRKMCPPPLMEWEQRFAAALEGLAQYSFVAGKLVLTWQRDEARGSMFFVRAEGGDNG
jgi:heat shock protein HslJ